MTILIPIVKKDEWKHPFRVFNS